MTCEEKNPLRFPLLCGFFETGPEGPELEDSLISLSILVGLGSQLLGG